MEKSNQGILRGDRRRDRALRTTNRHERKRKELNMQENQLLEALTREGVLINVSVRYWRATKKLNAEDIGLDPESVETRLISLGHKNLIPKESLQAFALIEGRAHALVEANSFPFLNNLAHFLPNSRLEETMNRLTALEQEFAVEKTGFMARYAQTREQALAEWREAAGRLVKQPEKLVAAIEDSFPCPERMERSFGFATQAFQITIPEGLGLNPVAMKDQMHIMQAREEAARQAAEKIRQGVEGFVSDCVASMREQTAKLCEDMLASMRDGKTGVHQKTLNRLVKFIDQFKALNFAGDEQMEQELERVKRELLSRTAEEYRDSEHSRSRLEAGLKGLADTARQLAGQDSRDLVERFGQMGVRKLRVDPADESAPENAVAKVA